MPTMTSELPYLVILGTVWLAAVSGVEGRRGAWGSSHSALVRRGPRSFADHTVADLVRDLFDLPAYPNSLMRQDFHDRDRVPSQPRFDVTEDDEGTMHLTMEVPGLSARDLNIELENDHVLRVNGILTRRKNGCVSETKFNQAIRLKDTIDPDRMEANLSSGLLTITIPEKPMKIRKVPVTTDERSILDLPLVKDGNATDKIEESND